MGSKVGGLARLACLAVVAAGLGPARPASAAEWVQNFVATELWSGPDPAAISLGTAAQWDYFQVIAPRPGGRLYVLVARSNSYAYLDAAAVGPAGSPPLDWPDGPTTLGSAAIQPAPSFGFS